LVAQKNDTNNKNERNEMKARKLGLLGLGDDGMVYLPSGRETVRLPKWIGRRIQRVWNWLASH
jgi:hypothetical protein